MRPFPAAILWNNHQLPGKLVDLPSSRAIIEARGVLPDAGQYCRVWMDFPGGRVEAEGAVSLLDPDLGYLAVPLDRVAVGGTLLLAAQLLWGEDGSGSPFAGAQDRFEEKPS